MAFTFLRDDSVTFLPLTSDLYLPPASTPGAPAGVHQVPDGHREAVSDAAHQGAEDAAAGVGAVAAQPQAARQSLAAHRRLRPPCGASPAHSGRGAQLQGQGLTHTQLTHTRTHTH